MQEKLPKITVVTPSYNQAQFLEQTILSVIGQQYPNLEYILMDGGSNDGSIDIIKKYEQHFTYWQSQKDNGQGSAINAGFAKATGDILCWLNSDDLYMPGTLLKIGRMFRDINEPTIIFGNCLHFHENGSKTRGSDVNDAFNNLTLELCDFIIQPSSFWNRMTWEQNGTINEDLHFTFDWDWFIRAKKGNVRFTPINEYLSLYRIHEAHKSGSGGDKRSLELAKIFATYNDDRIKKAFVKWNRYNNEYKWFHNIAYAARKYNISFINAILRSFISTSITQHEYNNISRM